MDRKIPIGFLIVGLVAALAAAGLYAYFSDTETSSGNTFTAGTLDLKMQVDTVWGDDGVAYARWSGSNMAPGDILGSATIRLKEFGTILADHLEISCSYTVTEVWQEPDTEDTSLVPDNFAKYLEISLLRYENNGWYINCLTGERRRISDDALLEGPREDWKVNPDTDGVPRVSLCDLKNDPLDNLPAPGYATHVFSMGLKFRDDAGNNLQGDTLNLTVIFTLNQHSSQ
jgi:predicted ribosomally synthesized peptide with SipW-like signal peptide